MIEVTAMTPNPTPKGAQKPAESFTMSVPVRMGTSTMATPARPPPMMLTATCGPEPGVVGVHPAHRGRGIQPYDLRRGDRIPTCAEGELVLPSRELHLARRRAEALERVTAGRPGHGHDAPLREPGGGDLGGRRQSYATTVR